MMENYVQYVEISIYFEVVEPFCNWKILLFKFYLLVKTLLKLIKKLVQSSFTMPAVYTALHTYYLCCTFCKQITCVPPVSMNFTESNSTVDGCSHLLYCRVGKKAGNRLLVYSTELFLPQGVKAVHGGESQIGNCQSIYCTLYKILTKTWHILRWVALVVRLFSDVPRATLNASHLDYNSNPIHLSTDGAFLYFRQIIN